MLTVLARIYAPANAFYRDGRHQHHMPATIDPDALAALAARGLAPNTSRTLTHDDAVSGLRTRAAAVPERAAVDAFVAGLGSAPVRWRAMLPATVLGTVLPEHPHEGGPGRPCDVCFVEPTVTVDVTDLWRSRHAHGSPLPGDVVAYLHALEQEPAPPWPTPTPHDVWVLHEILDTLRSLPPTTRAGAAGKALLATRLLPTRHAHVYVSLLEDLALLGLLATPEHPGLLTRFTTARERDRRPSVKVEVGAPLAFWDAGHGVDAALVERLFGHLPRPASRPDAPPSPAPAGPPRAARAQPLSAHLRGPAAAGDVYAIGCREDAWVLAYCHGIEEHGGRAYGRVEYLDGDVLPALPAPDALPAVTGFRGRRDGRWQQLTSRLEKTPRVRRLARGVPAPPDDRPAPDRAPFGNAADLRHLASWCFELDA